jgi:hypothetical protein
MFLLSTPRPVRDSNSPHTIKTDRHDITKILFNVALNTIALALLYIAHNVQDCSVLYNNAVRQVE